MGGVLIYGATGYTGQLVARRAKEIGMSPILAGRNEAKVRAVADPLGFQWRVADVDDDAALDRALEGIEVVLHIAGPFSATSRQMADACIRNHAHYLDITGEIAVIEALASRSNEAAAAGVMLMPGVGFDVVPSDCLAARVAQRLPDATELTLAIGGLEKASRGTLKSSLESVGNPVRVRRGGAIQTTWPPPRRTFDFGGGGRPGIAVGWGDVATAYYSTGVPDITVYFESMPQMEQMSRMGGFTRWLLSRKPMQALLKAAVDRMPPGPTDAERAAGKAILIGEAVNAKGDRAVSKLTTPEGYTLTALTSLEIVRRVLAGEAKPGFQTPSRVFGADFIAGFEGCAFADQ
ncbi:MAG TPA: saccharopine dehydrogenase NADP-binding domain-containing protein [Caulobacteraceae bacterium]|nr:saccharopine dehydrogenase NADP-binding domain-containing protein [Caulobacteraceae bacterium]